MSHNVKLILLNFVNDYTYRPTTYEEWKEHFEAVFEKMTGSKRTPKDIVVAYYDVAGCWSKE